MRLMVARVITPLTTAPLLLGALLLAATPAETALDADPAASPAVPTSLHTVPLSGAKYAVDKGRRAVAVPDRAREAVDPAKELVPAVSTGALGVPSFALVAVTWKPGPDDGELAAYARTSTGGEWTPWYPLPSDAGEHGPDPATEEASAARSGTAPLLGERADGVEVRVDTTSGSVPGDLRIDLVDPGSDAAGISDAAPAALAVPARTVSASSVRKPTIRSRAAWGADESMVRSTPSYATVRSAFVHHTVNSNSYSAAEVPGLMRSIYAYHVRSRGWNDIGYNFVVDRFGRIWEGRAGGVSRAVVGAHTAGYNSTGFAMSALGTYSSTKASSSVLAAFADLFAWKFAIHGVDPSRTAYLDTTGRNAILGHRNLQQTECPGGALYAQLPTIRAGVVARMAPFPRYDAVVAAGDANGDGNPDVAGTDRGGALRVYPGNRATGRIGTPYVAGRGWNTLDRVAGVGDFNGDGRDDLVGRVAKTGELYLYPGPGANRATYRTRVRIGTGWRGFDNLSAAGDLTGDGRPDLVANDNDGKLWLYPGNGRGGVSSRVLMGHGWYTIDEIAAGGDYTGDGKDDLVGRTTGGTLYVYPGQDAAVPFRSRIRAGDGYRYFDTFVGPGNWTPDAKPDLLLRGDRNNSLVIYYGNGSGGFKTGRTLGTGW